MQVRHCDLTVSRITQLRGSTLDKKSGNSLKLVSYARDNKKCRGLDSITLYVYIYVHEKSSWLMEMLEAVLVM